MKTIPLTKGKSAVIDGDLFEHFSQYCYQCSSHGYAVRRTPGTGKIIRMHREVVELTNGRPIQDGLEVDHINHNTLDNRRSNLRVCSHQENMRNRKKPINNTSGYKGVYWHKESQRWQAYIQHNRLSMFIGRFDTPEDAARAYDAKAIELFCDFAKTNFLKA